MFLWGDKVVTKVVENISEPRELQIFGLILAAKNLDHNLNQILWVSCEARYPIHGGGLEVFVERQRLG